jgi:cytochrome c oxidase subunit 2
MSQANETPPAAPRKPGAVLIGFLVLLVFEILILSNSGVRIFSEGILPTAISTYAYRIDGLFNWILGITGFFFILTQALLVYFCIRYRAKPGGKAKHTHGNHTLELVWTFVPGLILFCLAVFQTGTWGAVKFIADDEWPTREGADGTLGTGDDAFVVRVMGKQYQWSFWYAGPDSEWDTGDDVRKDGQLYVPVGRPVIVELQTVDVLHSFWLPNVRLKQDLLPGQTITQWFEVKDDRDAETGEYLYTGDYEVVCAELCGIGHTRMKGELLVRTQAEVDAWFKQMLDAGVEERSEHSFFKHWREPRGE